MEVWECKKVAAKVKKKGETLRCARIFFVLTQKKRPDITLGGFTLNVSAVLFYVVYLLKIV